MNWHKGRKCIFIVFCLIFPLIGNTQNFWRVNNTFIHTSCQHSSITSNPANDFIFVGTFNEGIYRSTNLGGNWEQVLTLPSDSSIFCLYVSKNGTLYAGSTGYVYYSNNNGDNWNRRFVDGLYPINDIVETTNGTLFAVTGGHITSENLGGIFMSDDHGETWEERTTGLSTCQNIESIAIDSKDYLYIGVNDPWITAKGGLYYSSNYGLEWHQILLTADGQDLLPNGIFPSYIHSLEIDPRDTLRISISGGAWESASQTGSSGVAVRMNMYKHVDDLLDDKFFNLQYLEPLQPYPADWFWDSQTLRTVFYLDNNTALGSTDEVVNENTYFYNHVENTWTRKSREWGANTGSKSVFTQLSDGKLFMVQLYNYIVYYSDSLRTSVGANTLTSQSHLNIYPVPAHEYLKLELTTAQNDLAKITICDTYGRKIKTSLESVSTGKNIFRIDCSSIPSGFYTISVQLKDYLLTNKIVKE